VRAPTAFRVRYGPTAVVVGASEGIGAAFAERLAAEGLDLLLVARNEERLVTFAASLSDRYRIGCRPVPADIGLDSGVSAVRAAVAESDTGLLVYNAAFAPAGPFLGRSVEEHIQALSVNCGGLVTLSHAVGQQLVSRGRGGIIIMCSIAGMQGAPWLSTYGATKAFDISFAEALHVELSPLGVDVLGCIAGATSTPGFVRSMGPPKKKYPFYVTSPDSVARAALKRLGKGPLVIAGGVNRTAAFVMRRFLPRNLAVRIMGSASAPADQHVGRH